MLNIANLRMQATGGAYFYERYEFIIILYPRVCVYIYLLTIELHDKNKNKYFLVS